MLFPYPIAAALLALCGFAMPASAKILIEIDKSAQRMVISRDGAQLYTWPVSTGARSYDTPGGDYTPFHMARHHFSREWDDAPMPNSIFFTKQGHAIHGTKHTRNIGRPASHGCVRLEPANAHVLFGLVKQEGLANVRVVLSGTIPGGPDLVQRAPGYDVDEVVGTVRLRRVRRPLYWDQYGIIPHHFYDDEVPYQRRPPPAQRFFLQQPWY